MTDVSATNDSRYGSHGRVLFVDLGRRTSHVETFPESVTRQFLGGYGLGAYLMWKHFPPGCEPTAPEACFGIVAGLLTGARTPFSGRIQIVGKSPLTGTWADSNSGGSVASRIRQSGYDALVVSGRASEPTVLVVRDDEVLFEPAGELWGQEIPVAFDTLKARHGGKSEVGISAIGPAGETGAAIASVMNDRYHAFGRQGFGAIYGSKNLKAIVVGGSGKVPVADEPRFRALCKEVTDTYREDNSLLTRFIRWMTATRPWLAFLYRMLAGRHIKLEAPAPAMRRVFSALGTTSALAVSVENGDGPVKNWKGVGTTDFPIATKGMKLDGKAVKKTVTRKLSCGDCPAPCKGIVASKKRGLRDVRRPDYETLCGFGAALLNDDLDWVTACHDACNRYGFDAVSSSSTLAWVCEAVDEGMLTREDLDGIDMRWGNGEAAYQLTEKIGTGEGCGAWLRHGVKRAAEHLGKGSEDFAVHVHGQEPAYHDPRFSSLMGVNFIADPTPGRHTSGSATWQETFAVGFPLPDAVDADEVRFAWKGEAGKGVAQAHYSNAHQTLNGLGLCMFTRLTGDLPWRQLVNALTGWELSERDLLESGERIQNLRAAFNLREGVKPGDFMPHRRMSGDGDGQMKAGPLKGITVPLLSLKHDYYRAMHWDPQSGLLSRQRAEALGIDQLLGEYVQA